MCDLGLPCGDPDCPWTAKAKHVWCPFADDVDFYDCDHIGVEESCTRGKNACPKIGISSYNPGPDKSPMEPEPWYDKREKTPTHMCF